MPPKRSRVTVETVVDDEDTPQSFYPTLQLDTSDTPHPIFPKANRVFFYEHRFDTSEKYRTEEVKWTRSLEVPNTTSDDVLEAMGHQQLEAGDYVVARPVGCRDRHHDILKVALVRVQGEAAHHLQQAKDAILGPRGARGPNKAEDGVGGVALERMAGRCQKNNQGDRCYPLGYTRQVGPPTFQPSPNYRLPADANLRSIQNINYVSSIQDLSATLFNRTS